MKIILLANYLPDQQESMQRYVVLLERLLREAGEEVEVIRPRVVFGWFKPSAHGVGKWLGYLDKFILFRWELVMFLHDKRVRGEKMVVHICDHSNSMYVSWLRNSRFPWLVHSLFDPPVNVPVAVTCHDLLAIKSALGLVPQNRTGWSGRILQHWILRGLKKASFVACDSTASRDDLLSLAPHLKDQSEVIDLPLSYPFAPIPPDQAIHHLRELNEPRLFDEKGEIVPYLFHVGGNQWYKNRPGVLRIFARLKQEGGWPDLRLIMAGKEPTAEMETFVREKDLQEEVIFPATVSNVQLNALYSAARAMVYPSLQEGFGWPLLEAQASGCLLVASNRSPLTEVGGPAALYADPDNTGEFAAQVERLLRLTPAERSARQNEAAAHVSTYSPMRFTEKMRALYRSLSS